MNENKNNASSPENSDFQENFELASLLRDHFKSDPPPAFITDKVLDHIRKQDGTLTVVQQKAKRPAKMVFLWAFVITWTLFFLIGVWGERRSLTQSPSATRPIVEEAPQDIPDHWVRFDLIDRLRQTGELSEQLGLDGNDAFFYHAFWDGEDPSNWWIIAVPKQNSRAGNRHYLLTQDGALHFEDGRIPDFSSPKMGAR